ncbi:MAG: hypothetical protein A2138_04005 [Deltaproteobacteria bacterium RBG_16_71_12]|nr:MAG: hypothetical protein A2138_04005 [Deltaproteobacteria bacterium RBG_16_71_12]
MSRVDPRFEAISRRLTMLELMDPGPNAPPEGSESPFARAERFVATYSEAGLRTAIREFGLDDKLRALGIADFELRITEEDPFRHRLEVLLADDALRDRHVMDLRLHLSRVGLPGVEEHADVVIVEWLLMQNPRGAFSKERPRLPGQRAPGTGLGREVAQLLMLLCRRVQREALITVPERFHLAELYRRSGWLPINLEEEHALTDVLAATRALSLAARAWAVERGFVRDADGAPFTYHPHERVMPVSERLERALAPGGFFMLREVLRPPRAYRIDVEALRRSLHDDPVDGLDPDVLEP